MRFRIGSGVFTIWLWPSLLTLLMLAILLALGTWQVQRLHWKENLVSKMNERIKEAPVDVVTINNFDEMDYRPARASGVFQHDREIHVTAISQKGEGGWHVLTPLRLKDGRYLLIDRGWVPYDKKSPAVRRKGQSTGMVRTEGVLRIPHGGWMSPVGIPEVIRVISLPEFLPVLLEADATPNPGGYPVGGQTRLNLPNNHLGYAITWYALALVLLVIYGVSGFRKSS